MEKEGSGLIGNPSNQNLRKFIAKELLDKTGFGFSSQQFVNVLFYLSGASIFLVGLVNGIRAALSIAVGVIAEEYNRLNKVSKRVIGLSGIFFGFSFLLMAAAKFFDLPYVFSAAMLLSGASIAVYGSFSQEFFLIGRKRELLGKIAKYGLAITAASLFLAAFLIDRYDESAFFILSIFGKISIIRLPGYLITFEIAALAFIISGYFLASIKDEIRAGENNFSFHLFFSGLRQKIGILNNKFLAALVAFNIAIGIAQIAGNSYYGIFIYENYKNSYFGGFLNISIVFLAAVFSSIIGYFIAKINTRSYGAVFMLVTGTIFLAAMPFAYYLKGDIALLTAGTIFGVIGASALGVSTSLLVIELLNEEDRGRYYLINGILSIIPYLVATPAISYAAQKFGLAILFLSLGIALAASAAFIFAAYLFFSKPSQSYF